MRINWVSRIGAHQRAKLERLCRYIARPVLATERLSLIAPGNIRYRPMAPVRMLDITLGVEDVVDAVHGTARGAEGKKRDGSSQQAIWVVQPPGEIYWR